MISVQGLTVHAGGFCLENVGLRIAAGEYAVLMGASGAGKTTLLEALCGLRSIAQGRLVLADCDVTAWPPAERGVGYVPQDVSLFSTMPVRDNLAYGLRMRGVERRTIERRVAEVAHLLGIEQLLERGVQSLSGGESRRVALGRAIAFQPKVLLLDEPLSGLDEATRVGVCEALAALHASSVATVLHVTHDARDAERLADRRLQLERGVIVETPLSSVASERRKAWREPAATPTPQSSAS